MNRQQANNGLGLQVALGMFGFFLAGVLSLLAGNSMTTSLIRGGIGMIGLFLLGFGLKFAWNTFVQGGDRTGSQAEGREADDVRGSHVDIVLPEHAPEDQPHHHPGPSANDEFVPLSQSVKQEQSLSDEEARKLADALRHLGE